MKKIIRLTESDLVRLVKRVIKEQSPFAPGMGPKTTTTPTPSGVNPTSKSSLKADPNKIKNAQDKEKFWSEKDRISTKAFWDWSEGGVMTNDVENISAPKRKDGKMRLKALTTKDDGYPEGLEDNPYAENCYTDTYFPVPLSYLPSDIKTNSCYSKHLYDKKTGGLLEVDIKYSCYGKLSALVKAFNKAYDDWDAIPGNDSTVAKSYGEPNGCS